MPEGLRAVTQGDFSAGAWPRQEDMPPNAVEDIINGLVADDGAIYRRGGNTYLGAAFGNNSRNPKTIWDGYTALGGVTLASLGDVGGGRLFGVNSADTTWTLQGASSGVVTGWPNTRQRWAALNGMVFASEGGLVYATAGLTGEPAISEAGTIATTVGSTKITGTGTNFGAGHVGMILDPSGSVNEIAVIQSVTSATELYLAAPWQRPVAETGLTYTMRYVRSISLDPTSGGGSFSNILAGSTGPSYLTTMFNRLIVARDRRVALGVAGRPVSFLDDEFHEMPGGARILGLQPLGDTLLIFTTAGVFALSGVAYDLTDALGNTQQRLDHIDQELVLWGDTGIAGWQGAAVVPSTQNVVLFPPGGGPKPIGNPIRSLYRSYVEAGYVPGLAAVYRSHYFLPVLTTADVWVDTLVCNLDTGAWSRMAGIFNTIPAMTRRSPDGTRAAKFIGLRDNGTDARAVDLTPTFTPSSSVKNDADGVTHLMRVDTRPVQAGELQKFTVRRLRIRYEVTGGPPSVAHWTAMPLAGSTVKGGTSDDTEAVWSLADKGQQASYELQTIRSVSTTILRAVDVLVRPSGRL